MKKLPLLKASFDSYHVFTVISQTRQFVDVEQYHHSPMNILPDWIPFALSSLTAKLSNDFSFQSSTAKESL